MSLVKEHMKKVQVAQRRVHNWSAKSREFQIWDRVAVLIPIESKYLVCQPPEGGIIITQLSRIMYNTCVHQRVIKKRFYYFCPNVHNLCIPVYQYCNCCNTYNVLSSFNAIQTDHCKWFISICIRISYFPTAPFFCLTVLIFFKKIELK